MGPRTVTLVVDRPRGVLAPFTVDVPWWAEVESVVAAARARFGVEVVVLRLLAGDEFPGGPVTYLAEVVQGDPAPFLSRWPDELPDDERRLPYARPGGPAADLGWAREHVTLVAAPIQVKTWNLSSIWRLQTADGTVWLKHVPPFFAHESPILELLGGLGEHVRVPALVAGEPGRMLLADIPGYDCYDATRPQLAAMVDALVDVQLAVGPSPLPLLDLGLPDWRGPAFERLAADVIERDAPADDAVTLGRLLDDVPARFAALAECGLPDVLVHGDFHPGNVRWSEGHPVLLDWGDCGIGHPLFDFPAFLGRAGSSVDGLRRRWVGRWAAAWPGSDPERAAAVIEPLAALRQAIIYRRFLDGIEQSEQVYHRDDVPAWLHEAAGLTLSEDRY